MSAFRPRLRADVVVTVDDDGQAWVASALMDRRFAVGPAVAAVARRLDGTRDWTELAADGIADAEAALRRLLLLALVEGAGDAIHDRYDRLVRRVDKLPHLVLEGSRFACQGSGGCCQNYAFGPLTDGDMATLAALDLRGAFPRLGEDPYLIQQTGADGKARHYLRSIDERCVFLESDRRCGLHAHFGADAKPGLCRVYPLEQVATLDGVKLYDRGTCATFARSARAGTALADDIPRLDALLGRQHILFHPVALLDDDLGCDHGFFLRWQSAALDVAKTGKASPPVLLAAVGRGMAAFAAALAECPLAPGEPDATIAAFLARDRSDWFATTADHAEGCAALATLATELVVALALPAVDGQLFTRSYAVELVAILEIIADVAARGADPTHECAGEAQAVYAVRVGGADVEEVLRWSLRQQLFGYGALVLSRPAPALLRIAMIQLIATFGARMSALAAGREVAVADDLSHGHMLATRFLGTAGAEHVLLRFTDLAGAALAALPQLVRLA